jgi:predicted secreted Zn-dependent protease
VLSYAVGKAKVEYFPIEGSTYKELMASLSDASAEPCADVEPVPGGPAQGDRIVAGCMVPSLRAKTLTSRTCTATACVSACTVTTVTGSTTVHLPRWVAPAMVPTLLLGWWKTVAADIRRHEARHVTIFNQWLAKLRKEAVGKSCASWPAISQRWSKKMGAAQAAIDRAELEVAWPRPPVEDY